MGGGWIKLDYAHHNVSHGGGGGGGIKLDYAHHNVSHGGWGGGIKLDYMLTMM